MEEDYISISTLNDFIFCPYSIYLHNVYMESDEGLYHATPQTRGRIAHETIDEKRASNRMIIISYDIKDDKLRTKFAKMLRANGAIRLQFSVYEVNNTQRIIDNIKVNIMEKFSRLFTGADSVMIFDAPNAKVMKYGNAIHRDKDVVYL